MKKVEISPKEEALNQKIEELFTRLDELDQESLRNNLNFSRKKYFRTKKVLRNFKKYEKQFNQINSQITDDETLRNVLLNNGVEESEVEEFEIMYREYLNLKKLVRESHRNYKNSLKEFQDLIANNYEYSRVYNAIVEESKCLVESIANNNIDYYELPSEDTFGVAYEGLAHAIINYNYYNGCPFSLYAKKIISREIHRNFNALIGYSYKHYLKKRDIERHLKISLDKDKTTYTASKIAEEYDKYNITEIEYLLKSIVKVYGFLDLSEVPNDDMVSIKGAMPISQDDYEYLDEFEDKYEVAAEENSFEDDIISRIDQNNLKEILEEFLKDFYPRNREILKSYYYDQVESFRALGDMYNLSHTQVWNIIEKIKRELRTEKYQKRLQPFCEEFKFFDQKKYFDGEKRISKQEFLSVFKKLYKLRTTNFSNEAKAVFCSIGKIKLDAKEIDELMVLINTFLINMQLDEKDVISIDDILEEFYRTYSSEYEQKYPYAAIYKMLQELREKDENPEDIKTLLNRVSSNTINNN